MSFGPGKCPHCDHELGIEKPASAFSDASQLPMDGDVSCCFHCGKFIIFGDGERHKMSETEYRDLPEKIQGQLIMQRNLVLKRKKAH